MAGDGARQRVIFPDPRIRLRVGERTEQPDRLVGLFRQRQRQSQIDLRGHQARRDGQGLPISALRLGVLSQHVVCDPEIRP